MSSQKIILLSVLITFAILLSLTVYINAAVPQTAIVSPTLANNSFTGVGYINVNVTSNQTMNRSDTRTYIVVRNVTGNGGIQNFTGATLRFNGAASGGVANSTYVNVTGLGNGTYEIYYEINTTVSTEDETSGINFTRFNYTITIDTARPTATVNDTADSYQSDQELTLHLEDNVNTSISYSIRINDLTLINGTGTNSTTFRTNVSALTNGTHRIRLEGIDSVGKANGTEKNITIDTAAPTATVNTTMSFNSSDTTPELSFSLTDNVNTSISYSIRIDDTLLINGSATNSTTFLVNLTALNNGTHRIRLESIDSVNFRTNSSEINITIDTTSPNITLSSSKTLVDLIGTVTLDCNAVDSHTGVNTSTIALTVTKPSGGRYAYSAGSYSYGSLSGETDEVGIYTASCAASDLIRNNNTASLTFEIRSPSSGTLGTPTPTPANATPVPVKEEKTRSITDISKPTDFIFTKVELPIKQISIDVKTAVDNVKVSAAETTAPTTGAPTASATDKEIVVSKYLELTATNLAADNIEKATIAFKVTKKWLTDNVLTVADVSLQRLVNSAWTKLSTRKTGETETEVSYEADTPGFSTFAIVGEKVKPVSTATPAPSATPAPTTTPATTPAATASPTPAPKAGMPADIWLYTGIAVAVIIIIVAVVFAMKRKK